MFTTNEEFLVYRDLADFHDRHGLCTLRDRFLVLAAAAAQSAGRSDEGEQLRQRLLQGNGSHLLRPFASLAEALGSPDVQAYIEDLRQEYPPHAAEDLLASVRASAPLSPGPLPLDRGEGRMPAPQRRSQRALPPTAPVIDLDNPGETLKVFPNQKEPNVPTLPAWEEPPRKTSFPSARPVKLLPATAAARPATVPVKQSFVQEPSTRLERSPTPDSEEGDEVGGRWVGIVLAVIVFGAGLYLAGVTLLQPFWP